jgi:hypothetical protein
MAVLGVVIPKLPWVSFSTLTLRLWKLTRHSSIACV